MTIHVRNGRERCAMTAQRPSVLSLALGTLLLSIWAPTTGWCDETLTLSDFEEPALSNVWEFVRGTPQLTNDGALQGTQSLSIRFDSDAKNKAAYLTSYRLPRDWTAYDALVLDVRNPNTLPISASVLVGDQAWRDKGSSYWNRHNGQRSLPSGLSQWAIPVRGLYRGEAGSRNSDIKRNIDPDSIVRVDFGFATTGEVGSVIIDHIRLVKIGRPDSVWAFDFGPPAQSTMLGWTPISNETAYSFETGYGWGPQGGKPWPGGARDTTFGTMLLQDFCEGSGFNFRVDVPPGQYRVLVFYENSGYWGGEQAKHRQRQILVQGRTAWEEKRPDGPAHALYRFEDTEPVGVDIWDTYMKAELARPASFRTSAASDGLTLRFQSDGGWGSKVAAVAIHRDGDSGAAEWLDGQLEGLATEFRGKALCLDPPAETFTTPSTWQDNDVLAWPVRIEDEVMPHSVPRSLPRSPDDLELSRLAVRAEVESFCLAVRPRRDLSGCRVEMEPFQGPRRLPAQFQVVRYLARRGFGNIAYRIRPHTLRDAERLDLPADVTREFVVSVLIPRDTPEGEYVATLRLLDRSGLVILQVPLRLNVRPIVLDRDTDFLMGFFGIVPTRLIPDEQRWDVLEQTVRMIRMYGMNAVSGGPNWSLTGWKSGKPSIDFGDMDRYFALLKKYGFSGALNGYGGARFIGLHDRYSMGPAAAKVVQESGLSYEEALMRAWKAVDAHARQTDWPTIFYAMCDETRVREQAESELEFMRLMGKVSAALPKTVRTSGSYGVNFGHRPDDPSDMLLWHQRFFADLDVSSLNNHDASVMDEARRLGKEIHIYNQGVTRYSFGLYQWSEYRKGIRARWQWHLSALHGYQFFDLDGREPDTAMICYGRDSLYPTIQLARCREGAEDFYLYNTLWKVLQRRDEMGDARPAVRKARALLEDAASKVALNQRQAPEGFDADIFKAQVVAAIESLTERASRD